MNNEIKEILARLSRYVITPDVRHDFDDLLDYITNLQEENKKIKELCNKYEEEHNTTFKMWEKDLKNFEHEKNRELKSRINKAVEYIENNYQYGNDISCYEEVELLDILKGENNE